MFQRKSRGRVKKPVENSAGWDAALAEARQRIEDLQFSVKVFEQKKAAGEPYPGQAATHN
jgi:hypothetical protein